MKSSDYFFLHHNKSLISFSCKLFEVCVHIAGGSSRLRNPGSPHQHPAASCAQELRGSEAHQAPHRREGFRTASLFFGWPARSTWAQTLYTVSPPVWQETHWVSLSDLVTTPRAEETQGSMQKATSQLGCTARTDSDRPVR